MFKVGDRVVFDGNLSKDYVQGYGASRYGVKYYGVVRNVRDRDGYCILVTFDREVDYPYFTKDGKYYEGDPQPSLSLVQSDNERKEFFHTCGQNVGEICDKLDKSTKVTIPVSALLSTEKYNGHYQSQLGLHGLNDIKLINDIALALEAHLEQSEGFDGYVFTQVWPDGDWTIYAADGCVDNNQRMLLSSLDR